MIIEEVTDPAEVAMYQAVFAAAHLNRRWLEANWSAVLPQAFDEYLAVAGQEPFIADTPQEARALAEAAHPGDQGSFVRFVSSHRGPRIYANRGHSSLKLHRRFDASVLPAAIYSRFCRVSSVLTRSRQSGRARRSEPASGCVASDAGGGVA
ncbi:MAG: hypothetical protein ACRC33_25665 [Gemmataceae bacterium]